MSFKAVLQKLKVTDIDAPKEIVTVESSESFETAFSKLVKANVLSAPVWSEAEKHFVGYLELRDLLSIVLSALDGESGRSPKTVDELLKHANEQLLATDGVTVTYMARRNPFKVVEQSATLYDVVTILAQKSATRVRRVAVVDDAQRIVNIISASRCISFLAEHFEKLGAHAQKTVKQLNLGSSPVLTVAASTPAIETYQLLDKNRISGVAITNEQGALFGNISARDLKSFISNANVDALRLPIKEFLQALRSENIDIRVPAILTFEHNTLAEVLAKLKATSVHRLYVVDSEEHLRPVRVVSVTDIMRHLLAFANESA